MVYGRYNELVNEVYKPTNITGGHHLVADFQESHSDMEVEMGVPPVIIHLIFGFSITNHPASGVPPCMETPIWG